MEKPLVSGVAVGLKPTGSWRNELAAVLKPFICDDKSLGLEIGAGLFESASVLWRT